MLISIFGWVLYLFPLSEYHELINIQQFLILFCVFGCKIVCVFLWAETKTYDISEET